MLYLSYKSPIFTWKWVKAQYSLWPDANITIIIPNKAQNQQNLQIGTSFTITDTRYILSKY